MACCLLGYLQQTWATTKYTGRKRNLDVHLFCVDGLKGFVETIGAVYPHSQVLWYIVHQIRSSTRFVSYKDIKPI